MPLSDHEQRMLDQIESALYAEDPKFASSVRGGTLRTPSTRRRLQGAGLFVLGLAMLIAGVAIKATMIGGFPALSVLGFIVMFGGVVFAVTGAADSGRTLERCRACAGTSASGQERRRIVHQSHGGPFPSAVRRVAQSESSTEGQPNRLPLFCSPTSPHSVSSRPFRDHCGRGGRPCGLIGG